MINGKLLIKKIIRFVNEVNVKLYRALSVPYDECEASDND